MNKHFARRVVSVLLLLCMLVSAMPMSAAAAEYNGFSYRLMSDGTLEITGYSGSEEYVVVPAQINGWSVTRIGEDALSGHSGLLSVTMPDSIVSIGKYAFYGCSSMERIFLPASLRELGSLAFSGCDRLTKIIADDRNPVISDIDGVLYADGGATLICCPAGRYGKVNVPEGVTAIGDYAFFGCATVELISLPRSLRTIGKAAFYGCSGLEELLLPDGVSAIPDQAFYECRALQDITLPQSVTSIGAEAFRNCVSLKKATVPSSVTTIASDAFAGTSGLKVYCPSGSAAMLFCQNNGIAFVPTGSVPDTPSGPPAGDKAERIAGSNRVNTAILASRAGWDRAPTVVLANGLSYPDALAGVPLASAVNAPILLTAGGSIEAELMTELRRLGTESVYILGGNAVISAAKENALRAAGMETTRLAGSNRYGTAVAIALELELRSDRTFTNFYFASASNFPDALAISSVAAIQGNPVLYINPKGKIDDATADFICGTVCRKGTVLGGYGAVSEKSEQSIMDLGFSVSRISGKNRYATALGICEYYNSQFTGNSAVLATGANFPDALSGGALAAHLGSPLVLVDASSADSVVEYINRRGTEKIYVMGGRSAVPESVFQRFS
ncbi:MAG: hypothetical protein E7554_00600 [Ruminococcaceae bacterium]|nr:hypothetical protein [Oscillospiraceae bacterium]